MNENLSGRFGRSKRQGKQPTGHAEVWILPPRLNMRIREYFEPRASSSEQGAWVKRPEIPNSTEMLDTDSDGSTTSDVVEIAPNKPDGAWASKGVSPFFSFPCPPPEHQTDCTYRRVSERPI